MGRPAELSRSYLESIGVTDVTPDGKVFVYGFEQTKHINTKLSRFGKQQYNTVAIYDPDLYQQRKNRYPGAGMKSFVVSRLMFAWFYGYVPANMDIDHIDGDSLNDDIDNLQMLTRKQNLAKRRGNINQYGLRLRDRDEDRKEDTKDL